MLFTFRNIILIYKLAKTKKNELKKYYRIPKLIYTKRNFVLFFLHIFKYFFEIYNCVFVCVQQQHSILKYLQVLV